MVVIRLAVLLLCVFGAFLIIRLVERSLRKADVEDPVTAEKEKRESTIKAAEKLDSEEEKAYKKAKKKIENIGDK